MAIRCWIGDWWVKMWPKPYWFELGAGWPPLANGPGHKYAGIDKRFDGQSLATSSLQLAYNLTQSDCQPSADWRDLHRYLADEPLGFYVAGNRHVSKCLSEACWMMSTPGRRSKDEENRDFWASRRNYARGSSTKKDILGKSRRISSVSQTRWAKRTFFTRCIVI